MDGSEIDAFLPTNYTYYTSPEEMNTVWKNRVQKRSLDTFLIPFGYGDGGGGPTRDHIEFIERQKNLEGGVRIEMENPVDYFERMESRGGPSIRMWENCILRLTAAPIPHRPRSRNGTGGRNLP